MAEAGQDQSPELHLGLPGVVEYQYFSRHQYLSEGILSETHIGGGIANLAMSM